MRFEEAFDEPPPACMSSASLKSLLLLHEENKPAAQWKLKYIKKYRKTPRGKRACDPNWLKDQVETDADQGEGGDQGEGCNQREDGNQGARRRLMEPPRSKKRKRDEEENDSDTESDHDGEESHNSRSNSSEPFFSDIVQWPKIDQQKAQIAPSDADLTRYRSILLGLKEFECVPVYFVDNGQLLQSVLWKRSDGTFLLRSSDCDDVMSYIGLDGTEESVMQDLRQCTLYMDEVSISQRTIIKNSSDIELLRVDSERQEEYWLESYQKLWDRLRKAMLKNTHVNILLNEIYDLIVEHRTYFRQKPWMDLWNHWTCMRVDIHDGHTDKIVQRISDIDEIMYENYWILSKDIDDRVC